VNLTENGIILNMMKPYGWTSFKVVKHVRRYFSGEKVGHAGTLDPRASGVLIVCVGKATKRVESLMEMEKEYICEIELGKVTDTLDSEGKIINTTDVIPLTLQQVKEAVNKFKGEIYQIPPMYSSIKVQGQPLYKLARKGKEIARKPRKINIYKIEVLSYKEPFISLRIVCSRGTYVRVLAQDIGERLECGAYLKRLIRTRIGDFTIKDSISPDCFSVN